MSAKKKAAAAKPSATVTDQEAETATKRAKVCRAADVGHSACDCGGPHCGDKITG